MASSLSTCEEEEVESMLTFLLKYNLYNVGFSVSLHDAQSLYYNDL